jgi:hypothetical protein
MTGPAIRVRCKAGQRQQRLAFEQAADHEHEIAVGLDQCGQVEVHLASMPRDWPCSARPRQHNVSVGAELATLVRPLAQKRPADLEVDAARSARGGLARLSLHPPGRPLLGQHALIGATLVFTDLVVMAGCTALAWRRLAALKSARQVRWTSRVFGTLFVVAGALLATFKRLQSRRRA